jgi:hypothetical protein
LSAAKATGAGEKKIGLEVYDHSQLLRLRYSVSLFNENGGSLSGNLVSSPAVWGHIQAAHFFDHPVLAGISRGAPLPVQHVPAAEADGSDLGGSEDAGLIPARRAPPLHRGLGSLCGSAHLHRLF